MRILYTLTTLLFLSTGCASLVNKVDKESLATVKKVAIIGFTYDQQAANSAEKLLDNVLGKNDSGPMGKLVGPIESKPHINHALEMTRSILEQKEKWVFLNQERVIKNPEVVKLYEKKNATIQTGVAPLKPHFYRYEASGVPQFYNIQFAEKAQLNSIASSLSVDALILVNISTRLSQTSVLGIGVGSISSVSDIALFVYDPKRSDFTVIMNASGDKAKTSDSQFGGFADKDTMNVQALQSYESALNKAVEEI